MDQPGKGGGAQAADIQGPPVDEYSYTHVTEFPPIVPNKFCPEHQFPQCPIPSYILKIPARKPIAPAPPSALSVAESAISLEFLRSFLHRIPGGPSGGASITRLVEELVQPSTGATLTSYASQPLLVPRCHLSTPTWAVVHSWDMPTADLVAALDAHTAAAGLPPAATHYWIAALAVSQHLLAPGSTIPATADSAASPTRIRSQQSSLQPPPQPPTNSGESEATEGSAGGGVSIKSADNGTESGGGGTRQLDHQAVSFAGQMRRQQRAAASRQKANVAAVRRGVLNGVRSGVRSARCGVVLVVGRDVRPLRRAWCLLELSEALRSGGPEAVTVLPLDKEFTRADLVRQLRELDVGAAVAEADEYDREVLAVALGVPPPPPGTPATPPPPPSGAGGGESAAAAAAAAFGFLPANNTSSSGGAATGGPRTSTLGQAPAAAPGSDPHTAVQRRIGHSSISGISTAAAAAAGGSRGSLTGALGGYGGAVAADPGVDDGRAGGRAAVRQLQLALLLRPMDGALPARMLGCPLADTNPAALTHTFSPPLPAPASPTSPYSPTSPSPISCDWLWDWAPINAWLALPPTHPHWPTLLLTGSPGAGKTTAMAAVLTHISTRGPATTPSTAIAAHFCCAGDVRSLCAAEVVRSIAYQWACRNPGFGGALCRGLLEAGGWGGGLAQAPDAWLGGLEEVVEVLLRRPMHEDAESRSIRSDPPASYLLLLDGIEEGPAGEAAGWAAAWAEAATPQYTHAATATHAAAAATPGATGTPHTAPPPPPPPAGGYRVVGAAGEGEGGDGSDPGWPPPVCPPAYDVLQLVLTHLRRLPGLRIIISATTATTTSATTSGGVSKTSTATAIAGTGTSSTSISSLCAPGTSCARAGPPSTSSAPAAATLGGGLRVCPLGSCVAAGGVLRALCGALGGCGRVVGLEEVRRDKYLGLALGFALQEYVLSPELTARELLMQSRGCLAHASLLALLVRAAAEQLAPPGGLLEGGMAATAGATATAASEREAPLASSRPGTAASPELAQQRGQAGVGVAGLQPQQQGPTGGDVPPRPQTPPRRESPGGVTNRVQTPPGGGKAEGQGLGEEGDRPGTATAAGAGASNSDPAATAASYDDDAMEDAGGMSPPPEPPPEVLVLAEPLSGSGPVGAHAVPPICRGSIADEYDILWRVRTTELRETVEVDIVHAREAAAAATAAAAVSRTPSIRFTSSRLQPPLRLDTLTETATSDVRQPLPPPYAPDRAARLQLILDVLAATREPLEWSLLAQMLIIQAFEVGLYGRPRPASSVGGGSGAAIPASPASRTRSSSIASSPLRAGGVGGGSFNSGAPPVATRRGSVSQLQIPTPTPTPMAALATVMAAVVVEESGKPGGEGPDGENITDWDDEGGGEGLTEPGVAVAPALQGGLASELSDTELVAAAALRDLEWLLQDGPLSGLIWIGPCGRISLRHSSFRHWLLRHPYTRPPPRLIPTATKPTTTKPITTANNNNTTPPSAHPSTSAPLPLTTTTITATTTTTTITTTATTTTTTSLAVLSSPPPPLPPPPPPPPLLGPPRPQRGHTLLARALRQQMVTGHIPVAGAAGGFVYQAVLPGRGRGRGQGAGAPPATPGTNPGLGPGNVCRLASAYCLKHVAVHLAEGRASTGDMESVLLNLDYWCRVLEGGHVELLATALDHVLRTRGPHARRPPPPTPPPPPGPPLPTWPALPSPRTSGPQLPSRASTPSLLSGPSGPTATSSPLRPLPAATASLLRDILRWLRRSGTALSRRPELLALACSAACEPHPSPLRRLAERMTEAAARGTAMPLESVPLRRAAGGSSSSSLAEQQPVFPPSFVTALPHPRFREPLMCTTECSHRVVTLTAAADGEAVLASGECAPRASVLDAHSGRVTGCLEAAAALDDGGCGGMAGGGEGGVGGGGQQQQQRRKRRRPHAAALSALAFAPRRQLMATAGALAGSIALWDPTTATLRAVLHIHPPPPLPPAPPPPPPVLLAHHEDAQNPQQHQHKQQYTPRHQDGDSDGGSNRKRSPRKSSSSGKRSPRKSSSSRKRSPRKSGGSSSSSSSSSSSGSSSSPSSSRRGSDSGDGPNASPRPTSSLEANGGSIPTATVKTDDVAQVPPATEEASFAAAAAATASVPALSGEEDGDIGGGECGDEDITGPWVTCIRFHEPGPGAAAGDYGAPRGSRMVPTAPLATGAAATAATAAAAAAAVTAAAVAAAGSSGSDGGRNTASAISTSTSNEASEAPLCIPRGSLLLACGGSSDGSVVLWAVAADGSCVLRTAELVPPTGGRDRGGGGVCCLEFLMGGRWLAVVQSCSTAIRVWSVQSRNITTTLRLAATCGEILAIHIPPCLLPTTSNPPATSVPDTSTTPTPTPSGTPSAKTSTPTSPPSKATKPALTAKPSSKAPSTTNPPSKPSLTTNTSTKSSSTTKPTNSSTKPPLTTNSSSKPSLTTKPSSKTSPTTTPPSKAASSSLPSTPPSTPSPNPLPASSSSRQHDILLAAVCTTGTELWWLNAARRLAALGPDSAAGQAGRTWAETCVAFGPTGSLIAAAAAPPAAAAAPDGAVNADTAAAVVSVPIPRPPAPPPPESITSVTLWDVRSGALATQLRGVQGIVRALAFSPDGALLAAAVGPGVVLWSVATGACLVSMPLHRDETSEVSALTFARRGGVLLAAGGTVVYSWDVQLAAAAAAAAAATAATVASASTSIAAGRGSTPTVPAALDVINAARGISGLLGSVGVGPVGPGGVVGGGAVGGRRSLITVPGTLAAVDPVAHSDRLASVCFSPSGALALSGGHDNRLRMWDVNRHVEVLSVELAGAVLGLTWSPDGTLLGAALSNGTTLVWHAEGLDSVAAAAAPQAEAFTRRIAARLENTQDATSAVCALKFSLDGKLLVTADAEGGAVVWNVKGWSELGRLAAGLRTGGVGRTSVLSTPGSGDVSGDAAAGRTPVPSAMSTGVTHRYAGVALSADGRWVLLGCGREVLVWSVKAKREAVDRLGPHGAMVEAIASSPGGKTVAVGAGTTVTIWGKPDPQAGGSSRSTSVSIGGAFTAGGGSGSVSFSTTGVAPPGPQAPFPSRIALLPALAEVTALAFSSDGGLLAASLSDGGVRVWETARWREVGWLTGHGEATSCLAFSPDGRLLVSGGCDGRCLAWSTRDVLTMGLGWQDAV